MTFWLVIFRAVHFAAALLAFGTPAFELLVVAPAARQFQGIAHTWRPVARWLWLSALLAVLLSGAGWFIVTAAQMTDTPPADIFRSGMAQVVWRATHFGWVWKVRLALWAVAAIAAAVALAVPSLRRIWATVAALPLGGALLASLAWAGHAGAEGSLTPRVWLDAVHLLTAGLWPTGVLPLAWLLLRLRHPTPEGVAIIGPVVQRYAPLGLAGALLLAATGTAQIAFITHPASLIFTAYGWLLAAKIGLYLFLVVCGSFIRLFLLRRIAAGQDHTRPGLWRALFWTLVLELSLTAGVVGIVAVLGITAPGTG